jgi:hypothetical protein
MSGDTWEKLGIASRVKHAAMRQAKKRFLFMEEGTDTEVKRN